MPDLFMLDVTINKIQLSVNPLKLVSKRTYLRLTMYLYVSKVKGPWFAVFFLDLVHAQSTLPCDSVKIEVSEIKVVRRP